jgi:hypothetical protein
MPGVGVIEGTGPSMDDDNAPASAARRVEYDDLTEIIVAVVLGSGILFIWLLLWSETNLGATRSFIWAVLVSCLLAIATDWLRAVMKP